MFEPEEPGLSLVSRKLTFDILKEVSTSMHLLPEKVGVVRWMFCTGVYEANSALELSALWP